MKIGLFFGTFNPIHVGHLVIANHIVEYSDLDQVWFGALPQTKPDLNHYILPYGWQLPNGQCVWG